MSENLFVNPTLAGTPGEHGLPPGFTLALYGQGVHFWKLPVRVEANVKVLASAGPGGAAALRVEYPGRKGFRLLDPWEDYLPTPGFVQCLGIRPDIAEIAPAQVDRVFTLVYWGRTEGQGYCHARIQGSAMQNDPQSVAWQQDWRRIEHTFLVDAGVAFDSVYFYVTAGQPGSAVEISGPELRYEGPFQPRDFQPRPRLQVLPEPNGATTIRVNPPTLVWPARDDEGPYQIEVAANGDFGGSGDGSSVRRHGGSRMNFFKLPQLLPPGTYAWRWRKEGGAFCEPIPFTMPADCAEYVTPTFEQIFAGLRREHPRLMVTRQTLPELRQLVTVSHAARWKEFLGRIGELEKRPSHPRGRAKIQIGPTVSRLDRYLFAWLISEDPAFAKEAKAALRELLAVPFEGLTEHRHSEYNHIMVDVMSLAYDWLYGLLTASQGARTREAILRRIRNMHDFYRVQRDPWYTFERFRYDSHGSYVMQSILRGALAVVDEEPQAKELMEYWLMAGVSFYPPWSDTDGSWAQGVGYGSAYVDHYDIPEARAVRSATGLSFFDKPFFRNHRDFILYAYPPFGAKAPFGDIGRNDGPDDPDLIRFTRIASVLAAEYGDPYAAWYAAAGTSHAGDHLALELMRPLPAVQPKAPTDLPLAKLFPDTGWALLHTDLTGKEDVFLAFKASPFGSVSHSHADQNSFTLSVGQRRLLTDAGYYAGYGTPHHLGYAKHTRAHNTILVDGRGQMINEIKAGGRVVRFAHGPEIDYLMGQAHAAYGHLLERFDRHVVFLRPGAFVVFDDIVTCRPGRIDWLLHSPVPFEGVGGPGPLRLRNGAALAHIEVRATSRLDVSMTDTFDPPPHTEPASLADEVFKREFHLSARTAESGTRHSFVTYIALGQPGGEEPPAATFVELPCWRGVCSAAGTALFRTGPDAAATVAGRRIETDARAVVLGPSGASLVVDGTRLSVDGRSCTPVRCAGID